MYSPKISEELVPTLYKISQARKIPMTRIVNEAIKSYLTGIDVAYLLREKTASEPPVLPADSSVVCWKEGQEIPIKTAREKVYRRRSWVCNKCNRCKQ